MYKITRNRKHV